MGKSRGERPLIFGHYSARRDLSAEHCLDVRARLTSFASVEGYALAGLFAEPSDEPATAMQSMINSALRRDVEAVAVSAITDLGRHGSTQRLSRRRLEDAGIRLLILVGGSTSTQATGRIAAV
jgi:hypothetical protein